MTEKEGMKGIGVGLLDLYDTKLCLQFFLLLFLQAFFFFFPGICTFLFLLLAPSPWLLWLFLIVWLSLSNSVKMLLCAVQHFFTYKSKPQQQQGRGGRKHLVSSQDSILEPSVIVWKCTKWQSPLGNKVNRGTLRMHDSWNLWMQS